MPVVNERYVAPVWTNKAAPAIDAEEMNAISRSLEATPKVLFGAGAPRTPIPITRTASTRTAPYTTATCPTRASRRAPLCILNLLSLYLTRPMRMDAIPWRIPRQEPAAFTPRITAFGSV